MDHWKEMANLMWFGVGLGKLAFPLTVLELFHVERGTPDGPA